MCHRQIYQQRPFKTKISQCNRVHLVRATKSNVHLALYTLENILWQCTRICIHRAVIHDQAAARRPSTCATQKRKRAEDYARLGPVRKKRVTANRHTFPQSPSYIENMHRPSLTRVTASARSSAERIGSEGPDPQRFHDGPDT